MFTRSLIIISFYWIIWEAETSSSTHTLTPAQINDLKELSEIPLDKLLKVRNIYPYTNTHI